MYMHIVGLSNLWALYVQIQPIPDRKYLKICICTEYVQTYFVITPYTIQYTNYLHGICVILGIISHLEMI